jgi:cytochrome c peroxidase
MPRPLLFAALVLLVSAAARCVAAEVTVAIDLRWRGESIAIPSGGVANDEGQRLRITRVAALLSGATLLRGDGSRLQLGGQYGFIDAEQQRLSWTLRNVPPGEFVGLEFRMGVPPEANHADPANWPAGHPLNPIVNGLHWGWQGGYVFLALEGRWQSDGLRTGAGERGFSYHIATDTHLTPVRFVANFAVAGHTKVRLALELSRVLGPVVLAAGNGSESTHSGAEDKLAAGLAAAAQRAWFWLDAAPTSPRATERPPVGARSAEAGGTPLALTIPAGFPQPALPADNPLTVEGVALGKALFFDRRLSSNGRQSCASCHAEERAFSDSVALSRGADGAMGVRNAMPLLNLAWSANYAWDGSQPRIRHQARAAWTNPIEMHAEPAAVLETLAQDETLAAAFTSAFGTPEMTAERVTLALEQYLLTQVAGDSKFDRALRGLAQFTEEEKRGFELFAMEYDPARGRRGADCFHCHGGALFSDFTLKNNGLDRESRDPGRAGVSGSQNDRGKFKTPSLRNVALTAPYMHDGRFKTLEEVVAHYDHGVQRPAALDPNIAKHPEAGLELSAADQRALVAFLETLTDARLTHSSPSQ